MCIDHLKILYYIVESNFSYNHSCYYHKVKHYLGVIVTKRNQIQVTLQNGPSGNLLKQGFIITLQATREPMTSLGLT